MAMRRFNFMIDPELDERLDRQSRREGISKGAILRRLIREHVESRADEELLGMAGADSYEPEHHDAVVYR
jgi:predicted DNA-binding protein